MAAIRVDGLEIDVIIDSVSGPEDASIEAYGRSIGDSLEGVTYSRKIALEFETQPMSPRDAYALEGWVRGIQHAWSFQRPGSATTTFSKNSDDGGLTWTNATLSSTAFMSAWSLHIPSNATTAATVSFGSEGDYTISGFHRTHQATNDWKSFVCRRPNSPAVPAESFYNGVAVSTLTFLSFTTASGAMSVRLHGCTATTTAASALFAGIRIAPFSYSDRMVASLASVAFGLPTTGFARPPYVVVTGSLLRAQRLSGNEAAEPGPILAKGSVADMEPYPSTVSTVFYPTARSLAIRLEEK
jgi:hypothetical protein